MFAFYCPANGVRGRSGIPSPTPAPSTALKASLTGVSGAATASFVYDGDGNRVKETNDYKNLAKGMVVTGSTGIVNPDVAANGDTKADSGNGVDQEYAYSSSGGLQYVQIDLGTTFPVNKVIVWHYNQDGRTYHNTKTQVSADGSAWVTVFDSAVSGEYVETLAGKTHTFTQQSVRYVRDYLNDPYVDRIFASNSLQRLVNPFLITHKSMYW